LSYKSKTNKQKGFFSIEYVYCLYLSFARSRN